MNIEYTALGLMSGTSGDGVDASLIITDGVNNYRVIKEKYFEYDDNVYKNIHNLKEKINTKKNLDEFVWDSMTMITLITVLKDKYNKKNINLKKMRSLKTILDLDNFINSYTK